jgi:type IV fimbrial biogenesis protein FimT
MTALRQRRAHSPHDQRTAKARAARLGGFSVIELLVVLAIAGILATIAVPSFQSLMQGNRIQGEISSLMNDIQYTRAEALRTGQTVSICASSNGTACNITTGNWRDGWIIFSDATGNRTVDSGDTVLRVRQAFNGTDSLQSIPPTAAFAFNRLGFTSGLNTDVLMLANTTPANPLLTRCLALNVVGRMQLQTPTTNPTTCQ